eukprot:Lithocolla_globosa_v1_NODE_8470_length_816_cov_54.597113.p1 type:complete len:108 gc:universal NODE_8470_length_816_cov_54.597113:670-347(-)
MPLSELQESILNPTANTSSEERPYNVPLVNSSIITMDNNEIHEILKSPVKKSVIRTEVRNRYIFCDICGVEFTANNATGHRKTKVHQAYFKMNDRIRNLLLSNPSDQ